MNEMQQLKMILRDKISYLNEDRIDLKCLIDYWVSNKQYLSERHGNVAVSKKITRLWSVYSNSYKKVKKLEELQKKVKKEMESEIQFQSIVNNDSLHTEVMVDSESYVDKILQNISSPKEEIEAKKEYTLIPVNVPVEDKTLKDTNPKDAIGSGKIPMHLWPDTASAMGCIGLLDGMLKYGRSNFRVMGIRSSIYYDACRRHIDAWFSGEDYDRDSGVPHLSHALACLAIIVDAQAAGKFVDDRMVKGGYRKVMDDLTPHVARLKALHANKNPRHFTIQDNDLV